MATVDTVYNTTTTAPEPKSRKWIIVPSEHLDKVRFVIKVMEVVSSTFHVLSENTVFPRWTQMRPHVCIHVGYGDPNLVYMISQNSLYIFYIAIHALSFIVA